MHRISKRPTPWEIVEKAAGFCMFLIPWVCLSPVRCKSHAGFLGGPGTAMSRGYLTKLGDIVGSVRFGATNDGGVRAGQVVSAAT